MSLYEATAHIFYGVRIQRMGRDADPVLPLGTEDPRDHVQNCLPTLDRVAPDAYSTYRQENPKDKDNVGYWKALQDPESRYSKLLRARRELEAKLTFGCGLLEMGSKYDADDWVIYAAISESDRSCSSEDDHGGFGETVLTLDMLTIGEDWDERLSKFCALIGVPADLVKPRWTLSMRG